ncbi:AAA family ATPase [Flavobacterium tegetincola]|uniref:AAA family ATPase n=1 Tax=Flavobacterium tegetincola TaxID=150172 RepID=UPI00042261AF|nr:AAA family ATPase [Flavobacterium tegetincola]
MIIKEVIIENYLCYYGVKKFSLSNGLNIILGENGEGKTKFFEALEWLLNGDNNNLDHLVSKKALSEVEIDKSFRVRVEIVVEQYNEIKILSKQFTVKKKEENRCSVGNSILAGTEESSNGERNTVDGRELLEQIFPSQIRRYSMFKGEEELNIFDNADALINLINLFSEAKHYEKYESKGESLKVSAEKAVEQASRNNNKNQEQYNKLDFDIKSLEFRKHDKLTFLEVTNSNIEKTTKNIQEVEKYINNAEALDIINSRIKKIESEISKTEQLITENYTTSLFDEGWMLMNFETIHKEFADKVTNLSKERRTLQSEYDKQIGIKEGENRVKLSLLNDLVPLPIGTPSKAIMEEMIKEHICKVCNREAEEGSEALKFMNERLQQYLQSQSDDIPNEEIPEKLYKHNYINRLINLSTNQEDNLFKIRTINSEIEELFKFNQARKDDLVEFKHKLEKELIDRERIIGNSAIGSEKLSVVLKDYNSWQRDIKNLNIDLNGLQLEIDKISLQLKDLQEQKEKIDLTNVNNFLINTRNILRDIDTIFKDTKTRKFDEFISQLAEKSNQIFSRINIDAFTGTIDFRLIKTETRVRVKIQLLDENDFPFPENKSLETSKHISVLLAISELTKEVKAEKYPLIFDAPTSSFGESKMTEFLNLIYEAENQTIILIKDYIAKDENKNLYIKPEFEKVKRNKAFWVRLERPFDEKNLKTINTERIEL